MTSISRKLALVAALAAALPAAAHARPCDDDRWPTAVAYPAPPQPAAWREGDRDRDDWREHRRDEWRDRRRDEWRERERAELRGELGALEDQRADFHARFGWNGRRAAQFERWYGVRRAELQRRWDALEQYAWR
jgi:hypothetical protein